MLWVSCVPDITLSILPIIINGGWPFEPGTLTIFYRQEKWGRERLHNLLKVTELRQWKWSKMPPILLFWYIAARTSWAATMQQKLGSMFHKHDLILTTMLPSWMLDIHYYTWATSLKAASHLQGENHLTPKPIPVCVPQTSVRATLLFLLKRILHLLALVTLLMPLNPLRFIAVQDYLQYLKLSARG